MWSRRVQISSNEYKYRSVKLFFKCDTICLRFYQSEIRLRHFSSGWAFCISFDRCNNRVFNVSCVVGYFTLLTSNTKKNNIVEIIIYQSKLDELAKSSSLRKYSIRWSNIVRPDRVCLSDAFSSDNQWAIVPVQRLIHKTWLIAEKLSHNLIN